MVKVNEAEPIDGDDSVCRPAAFEIRFEFMYWTQMRGFLDSLFAGSSARLDVKIEETLGGFSACTIRSSHLVGLKDVYDAYENSGSDFVDKYDTVNRGPTL